MTKEEVLALITSAPGGQVESSAFFAGKHSQRAQLPVVNLLAQMRRDGLVKTVKQDGKTFYKLPS